MSTYVIGDIQGCYDELIALLDSIHFSEGDALWLVGDLVNRGPQSLEVLRFLKNFRGTLHCVLGNHDLHLLACAQGVRPVKPSDTFSDVLTAPDRDELLFWLRQQSLIHYDEQLQTVMAHAGIYPFWHLADSLIYAQSVQDLLQSDHYALLMQHMYGDVPTHWSNDLDAWPRYRFIINAFTRMRTINDDDSLNLNFDGPLADLPKGCQPWFNRLLPEYRSLRIVFGHWAALMGETHMPNVNALDTGCVWGRGLTAQCLESNKRFLIPSFLK